MSPPTEERIVVHAVFHNSYSNEVGAIEWFAFLAKLHALFTCRYKHAYHNKNCFIPKNSASTVIQVCNGVFSSFMKCVAFNTYLGPLLHARKTVLAFT